jgi:hypothetical protein
VLLAILRNGDKGHRQAVCVAVASHAAALAVHKVRCPPPLRGA